MIKLQMTKAVCILSINFDQLHVFLQKLHENEWNWTERGRVAGAPLSGFTTALQDLYLVHVHVVA